MFGWRHGASGNDEEAVFADVLRQPISGQLNLKFNLVFILGRYSPPRECTAEGDLGQLW